MYMEAWRDYLPGRLDSAVVQHGEIAQELGQGQGKFAAIGTVTDFGCTGRIRLVTVVRIAQSNGRQRRTDLRKVEIEMRDPRHVRRGVGLLESNVDDGI